MCGAIQLTITGASEEAGACHCDMCRQWSGGVYVAVTVPADGVQVVGEEHVKTYTSSPWAERAFCDTCGSNLWYRVTAPGPYQGQYHLGLGMLDDPNGLPLKSELFIDRKPDGYSFAEETQQMTAQQVMDMFADL